MRKTYAYSSIFIGALIGMAVGVKYNGALGVVACIAISIGGFIAIRAIENAMAKGAEALVDQVTKSRNAKKGWQEKAEGEVENLSDRFKTVGSTSSPAMQNDASSSNETDAPSNSVSSDAGAETNAATRFCPSCGAPLQPGMKFCRKCGEKVSD